MDAMANPTRRTELLDEGSVPRHRSLFCSEYDDCLELAAGAQWTSWSCERCPLAKLRGMHLARLDATADAPELHDIAVH